MAASDVMKPFTTEETRRILDHLQQPAVFTNMTCDWPVLRWTAEHLSVCLGDKLIRFRLGRKEERNSKSGVVMEELVGPDELDAVTGGEGLCLQASAPLFETQCSYVEARLDHFLCWTRGQCGADVGPFSEYSYSEYWAYADYKYIAMLFEDQPLMFEDVKWADFGFEGRSGRESTLWIGTEGANTPCHLDSYGCNLVLQVQGRKRWHLFPPEDSSKLYPTRIPYEESSVFSQVDVLRPDLRRFPDFRRARVHVVTLRPGQVLYVPRHWWHYVESVDPVTVSVNSWIELDADDVARVSEAVTKAVVCAMKREDDTDDWLNPTEEGVASHNENMQYLNLAITACARSSSRLTPGPRDASPAKRDSSGQIRNHVESIRDARAFSVPFGPHLIAVETRETTLKDAEVKSSRKRGGGPPEDPAVRPDRAQRTEAAVRVQPGGRERSPGVTPCGSHDCSSEDSIITTNDLLDCLVHPDVIARVTELLLERHSGAQRTSPLSQL